MKKSSLAAGCILLVLVSIETVVGDTDVFNGNFTGSLDGEVYQLSISGYAGGQYEGLYSAGGEIMPLNARRFGDRIAGQIGIADFRFGFMAQIQPGGLLFRNEDGREILFKRN